MAQGKADTVGMRVALIVGGDWLSQERTMLRRLIVGLIDERVRVVRVAPGPAVHSDDQLTMTTEQLWYGPSRWRIVRDFRLRRLTERLGHLEVDLIHVLDGTLQAPGLRMAAALDVPLVASVWSLGEVEALRETLPGVPMALATASPALAEACRRQIGAESEIRTIPPGVFINEDLRPPLANTEQSLCCLILGDGQPDDHYLALLQGIADVRERLPETMFFLYSMGADQHRLWQACERLDLLNHLSVVQHGGGVRQLLVQADAILLPQPMQAVRTLVHEAMAAGRPVIAAADRWVDHLREGETARLVPEPEPSLWAALLRELLARPQQFIDLGGAGRQYIRQHHATSAHVSKTMELYRQLAPESIPIRGSRR